MVDLLIDPPSFCIIRCSRRRNRRENFHSNLFTTQTRTIMRKMDIAATHGGGRVVASTPVMLCSDYAFNGMVGELPKRTRLHLNYFEFQ